MRILAFVLVILLLSGCTREKKNDYFEWVTPSDSIDLSSMELYCRTEYLRLGVDDDARISLYVRADITDDGEFIFDDGQVWLLTMETSFGNYPLFPRRYVQLGMVNYTVFYEYSVDAYDVLHVLVTVGQSAGYEIFDYIFDSEKEAFKVVPVYSVVTIGIPAWQRASISLPMVGG